MRKSETGFDTRTKKKIPPGENQHYSYICPVCQRIRSFLPLSDVQRNQGNQLPKKAFGTFLPALPATAPRKNAGTECGFYSLTPWPPPCIYFVTYLFR